jgi:hypothetical protein
MHAVGLRTCGVQIERPLRALILYNSGMETQRPLFVCVCMYVCMCVCMYMYVCVCVCMYMYVCVCMCMYVCICMYAYVYVCV